MKTPSKTLFLITLGFFIALALVDKLVIQKFIPTLYEIASFQMDINFWTGVINIPSLSLISFILIPLLILLLCLIPYKSLKTRSAWIKFWERYKKIVRTSFWIPFLIIIGALIYLIFKNMLPDSIKGIAEALTVSIKIFFTSSQFLRLDFGLTGIIGLVIGLFLWYKQGFKIAQ